jgi:hypothetical protein
MFSERENNLGMVSRYAQTPEIIVLAGKMKGFKEERIQVLDVPSVDEDRQVLLTW